MKDRGFIIEIVGFFILIVIVFSNISQIHSNIVLSIFKSEVRDTPETMRIVREISRLCENRTNRRSCLINEVENFIISNVTRKDDNSIETLFHLNNSIDHTLEYGNDCEGIAILTADLFKQLQFEDIYLIEQVSSSYDIHICVLLLNEGITFCNTDKIMRLQNITKTYEIIGVKKVS